MMIPLYSPALTNVRSQAKALGWMWKFVQVLQNRNRSRCEIGVLKIYGNPPHLLSATSAAPSPRSVSGIFARTRVRAIQIYDRVPVTSLTRGRSSDANELGMMPSPVVVAGSGRI